MYPPFGLLLGYLLLIRVGVPSRLRFKESGRFLMSVFSLCPDRMPCDVSQAWAVWSGAVESALVDAYRFSGGPLPSRGLVLG